MAKKDPDVRGLNKRNSLSRQARRTAKTKRNKNRGGGFSDRFVPPSVDEDAVKIILFPPEEPYKIKLEREKGKPKTIERDYGIVQEHYNGVIKRGCKCTAGLKRVDDENGVDWYVEAGSKPCVPCYELDQGAKQLNIRKLHLFNLIKLGWFHKVEKEVEGKKGTIKVEEYRPCRGEKCKYCKKGHERIYGQRMYWPLGSSHLGQLIDAEISRFSKRCACDGKGKIEIRAFLCEECEEAVRDIDEEPLEKGELRKLRDDVHECPHCGYEGYLKEYLVCNKCKNPRPLELWDVVMKIQKSGEGTQSIIQITGFSKISRKVKAKVNKLMEAYDWDKLYQFRDLEPEEQAKLLQLDNPFGTGTSKKTTKGAANWDDNDNDDDDEDDDE